jgi:hypothetical protein
MSTVVISDIQTENVLFYDEGDEHYKDAYRCFCRDRDIDCLPDANDPNMYYRYSHATGEFEHCPIEPSRYVEGHTYAFAPELLEMFQNHKLLFVRSHGVLTGVVHFSDYNHRLVSAHLYAQLSDYEVSLRQLLVQKGLKDDDMRKYLNQKRNEAYGQGQNNKPQFQTFYLKDLIALLRSCGIVELGITTNSLRNMIMHAHELVGMNDVNADDLIFRIDSFERFFNQVQILQKDHRRVKSRLMLEQPDNQRLQKVK